MKRILSVFALLGVLGMQATLFACSCAPDLPSSFCESMWYWPKPSRPNNIVLAVKLNNVTHGMDMKVVDVLYGYANDTIRVWGDPGHLCRPYTDGIPIGDTLLMALDSLGYFYDVEKDGDYAIGGCGVYYLAYQNGMVIGRVFEPLQQQISYTVFKDSIRHSECNPDKVTGISEAMLQRVGVHFDVDRQQILFSGTNYDFEMTLLDISGKAIFSSKITSGKSSFQLPGIPTGVYLVALQVGNQRVVKRVLMGR